MIEEFGQEFYIYVEPCHVKFDYEHLNHYCKLFGTCMFELSCFKVWFHVLEKGSLLERSAHDCKNAGSSHSPLEHRFARLSGLRNSGFQNRVLSFQM